MSDEKQDERCSEIGFYLDNSRTAMLRYYDYAMNSAKFEKNPNAAIKSLSEARDIIDLAIESFDKVLCQDEAKEESDPVVAEVAPEPAESEIEVTELVGDEIDAFRPSDRTWFDEIDADAQLLPYESLTKILDEFRRRIDEEKPKRRGRLLYLLHETSRAAILFTGYDDSWSIVEQTSDYESRGLFLRANVSCSDVAKILLKMATKYEDRFRNDPRDMTSVRNVLLSVEKKLFGSLSEDAQKMIDEASRKEIDDAQRVHDALVPEEERESKKKALADAEAQVNRRGPYADNAKKEEKKYYVNVDCDIDDFNPKIVSKEAQGRLVGWLSNCLLGLRYADVSWSELTELLATFATAACCSDFQGSHWCDVPRAVIFQELTSPNSARGLFLSAKISYPEAKMVLKNEIARYEETLLLDDDSRYIGTVTIDALLRSLERELYQILSDRTRKLIWNKGGDEYSGAKALNKEITRVPVREETPRGLVNEDEAREVLEKISRSVSITPSFIPWRLIVVNLIAELFKRIDPYPGATEYLEKRLWHCASRKGTYLEDNPQRRKNGTVEWYDEAREILRKTVVSRLWRCKAPSANNDPMFVPYENEEPVAWEDLVGYVVWEFSKICEISEADIQETLLWTKRLSYHCESETCRICREGNLDGICSQGLNGALDAWIYSLNSHREISRPRIIRELVEQFCFVPTRKQFESVVNFCKDLYPQVEESPYGRKFTTDEFLSGREASFLATSCQSALVIRPGRFYSLDEVVFVAIKHVYVGLNLTDDDWNALLAELLTLVEEGDK